MRTRISADSATQAVFIAAALEAQGFEATTDEHRVITNADPDSLRDALEAAQEETAEYTVQD
jgi:hypothetical protein